MENKNTVKKSILVLAISVVLNICALFFLSRLYVLETIGAGVWIFLTVFILLALNSLVLSGLFFKNLKQYILAMLPVALSVLLFFPWHWLQLIGAVGIYISLVQGWRFVKKHVADSRHFSYSKTSSRGMHAFLLALILLASINVYIATEQSLHRNPEEFYLNISSTIVESIEPVLSNSVAGYSSDMTIREFLLNLGRNTLDKVQERATQEGELTDFESNDQQVVNLFGVQVDEDQQIKQALIEVLTVRAKRIFEPVQKFIPLIYALLILASLRFLVPVVRIVAIGLGMLTFKLFKRLGWVAVEEKQVTAEIPRLT